MNNLKLLAVVFSVLLTLAGAVSAAEILYNGIELPYQWSPMDIKSDHINVFINENDLVEIEVAFSRADFCSAATDDSPIDVTVIGQFTSGQYFYGTDTIRIINKHLEHLVDLTSYWLGADCSGPDWFAAIDKKLGSLVTLLAYFGLCKCLVLHNL